MCTQKEWIKTGDRKRQTDPGRISKGTKQPWSFERVSATKMFWMLLVLIVTSLLCKRLTTIMMGQSNNYLGLFPLYKNQIIYWILHTNTETKILKNNGIRIYNLASLRRDHTLSSDLPLMRLFFISPQQKISSLHTGNETDSEFEVFSKRITFWNIMSNFICFSLHTRSSSCQLGKCTRKLLLIPLIAMESGNALDLPLSGISLNTSMVLDCII